MLVDSLREHHHVEVGVANAQHVVRGVRNDVHLTGDQRGGIRRTRCALHQLARDAAGLQEAIVHSDLSGQAAERRSLTDSQDVNFRITQSCLRGLLSRAGAIAGWLGRGLLSRLFSWLLSRFLSSRRCRLLGWFCV